MNEHERHNLFSELIARHQSELYAYIFAIVRSWENADDLFQSVCVVLWRKFETFQTDTSFFSWARQTAKFEEIPCP
jgi:RNA polymerase sigma-70 factor (ECF subfamily)